MTARPVRLLLSTFVAVIALCGHAGTSCVAPDGSHHGPRTTQVQLAMSDIRNGGEIS